MEEKAVVTIRSNGKQEDDFEIPRNIRSEKWMPIVEQYMRSENGATGDLFLLYYNGNIIKDNDTLQSLGIWDGSILDAEWR